MTRGHRKEYFMGYSQESEKLYKDYQKTNCYETAQSWIKLLSSLDKARQEKWIKIVEEIDIKYLSRKSWNLLRKINSSTKRNWLTANISPDPLANHIIKLSRVTVDKKVRRNLKIELGQLRAAVEQKTNFAKNFEEHEVNTAIKNIKLAKAAGLD